MTIGLWAGVGVLFLLSFFKNRQKTKVALVRGFKSLAKISLLLLNIMALVGITLTFIGQDLIRGYLGEGSGLFGIVAGLVIGSVAFLPSFIAFPLGATLLEQGAGLPQIGAFISTLMGVGVISLPMEFRYFGKRLTILRTVLCFVIAIVFVVILAWIKK